MALLTLSANAQVLKFGEAKGLFMSVGVGPRIPVGDFSESHNIGSGLDVTFSYTDNIIIPLFIYSTVGFQHHPGRQNFYKESDHSSISTNLLYGNIGVRHYFQPLVENIVLLMPIVDGGISFAYLETSHQYTTQSGRNNSLQDLTKFGAHIGAGFSMFLLDVVGYYNYFHNNQFISLDLKVTIPIFVTY